MMRYFWVWLSSTALLLTCVTVFNVVIDPYRIFQIIDKPGFNRVKPKAGTHGPKVKKYLASRIDPGALILGNSRAEVGFDPSYSAWPKQAFPVFNFALPGTGNSTSLASLKQVLGKQQDDPANRLQVLVWGLDYMDFLVASTSRSTAVNNRTDDAKRSIEWLRDYAEAVITMTALLDSLQTLLDRQDPFASDLTVQGFNPMRDYIKIAADEGYWALFRAKDLEGIKAYISRPKTLANADGISPDIDNLKEVIKLCEANQIALHLVMYPYHAHLLETLRITGHWANYEAWKKKIVSVVSEADKQNNELDISLWDFSGFNNLTAETVPQKQDKRATMRWYWEAGHFKAELGNLILDRIFGRDIVFPEFGVLLNGSNIEQHLLSIQAQALRYRQRHLDEVHALEQMASQISKDKNVAR